MSTSEIGNNRCGSGKIPSSSECPEDRDLNTWLQALIRNCLSSSALANRDSMTGNHMDGASTEPQGLSARFLVDLRTGGAGSEEESGEKPSKTVARDGSEARYGARTCSSSHHLPKKPGRFQRAAATCCSCAFPGSTTAAAADNLKSLKLGFPLHELDDDDIVTLTTEAFQMLAIDARSMIMAMEDRIAAGRQASDDALPLSEKNKATVWEGLLSDVSKLNENLTNFAQSCPGFSTLPLADKTCLVKNAFLSAWLISKSELFVDGETHLILPNNVIYTRRWMTQFLPQALIEKFHAYASLQNAACLTVSELSLICAISLMCCDETSSLLNHEVVYTIRSRLLLAMEFEVKRNRVNPNEALTQVERLLSDLAAISMDKDLVFNVPLKITRS